MKSGALRKKCDAPFLGCFPLIGNNWRPEKNNMRIQSLTGTLNRIFTGRTCAFPFDRGAEDHDLLVLMIKLTAFSSDLRFNTIHST